MSVPGERLRQLTWELGADSTCDWITIDPSTGELSWVPTLVTDLGTIVHTTCVPNVSSIDDNKRNCPRLAALSDNIPIS